MSLGISHLMFAYDCLLFFQANTAQTRVIKDIIEAFEKGTGQMLSANKCSLLFSESCHHSTQTQIKQTLEVSRDSFEDKYLGYPTPEGG
jgi:hypothetical protein